MLYVEYQICDEQDWNYNKDWLQLPLKERSRWIAYFNIKGEEAEKRLETDDTDSDSNVRKYNKGGMKITREKRPLPAKYRRR